MSQLRELRELARPRGFEVAEADARLSQVARWSADRPSSTVHHASAWPPPSPPHATVTHQPLWQPTAAAHQPPPAFPPPPARRPQQEALDRMKQHCDLVDQMVFLRHRAYLGRPLGQR